MRKNVILSVIASALLVMSTTAASALDISAVFNLGASNFANGVQTVNSPQDIVVDLTAGDVVAFDIVVTNTPQDTIESLFASLIVDQTQVSLLGGGFQDILVGSCTGFLCTPPALSSGIAQPINKPNSPASLGAGDEQWIQVLAHTAQGGTDGTAPNNGLTVGLTIGVDGFQRIDFGIGATPGDAIAGPGGSPFTGTVNFSGAVINVPEPGTALLMGLGLFGLGVAGRRRS